MDLVLLLVLPALSGLLCLTTRQRQWWERLNLAGFAAVAVLAARICAEVIHGGQPRALNGFLRVDALSALVLGLTAFVSLATAVYAVGYFRRDQQDGRITAAQLRHYYVLTPLFVSA